MALTISPRLLMSDKAENLDPAAQEKLAKQKKQEQAQQVAREFESLFSSLVLKSMRTTATPEDSSNALDIYTDMLDREYSNAMADANLGVGQMIMQWMQQNDPDLSSVRDQLNKGQSDIARQKAIQSYSLMSPLGK